METKISKDEYMEMYEIIGAAIEVHNCLGRGMEEAIYQEALEIELAERKIPFEREKRLNTYYKGQQLEKYYIADFYSNDIMIELKSVSEICSDHRAQLFNYMRITKTQRGILINFGERSLRAERYIYQKDTDDFALLSEKNLSRYIAPNN